MNDSFKSASTTPASSALSRRDAKPRFNGGSLPPIQEDQQTAATRLRNRASVPKEAGSEFHNRDSFWATSSNSVLPLANDHSDSRPERPKQDQREGARRISQEQKNSSRKAAEYEKLKATQQLHQRNVNYNDSISSFFPVSESPDAQSNESSDLQRAAGTSMDKSIRANMMRTSKVPEAAGLFFSPSDLSNVSTAPPTPASIRSIASHKESSSRLKNDSISNNSQIVSSPLLEATEYVEGTDDEEGSQERSLTPPLLTQEHVVDRLEETGNRLENWSVAKEAESQIDQEKGKHYHHRKETVLESSMSARKSNAGALDALLYQRTNARDYNSTDDTGLLDQEEDDLFPSADSYGMEVGEDEELRLEDVRGGAEKAQLTVNSSKNFQNEKEEQGGITDIDQKGKIIDSEVGYVTGGSPQRKRSLDNAAMLLTSPPINVRSPSPPPAERSMEDLLVNTESFVANDDGNGNSSDDDKESGSGFQLMSGPDTPISISGENNSKDQSVIKRKRKDHLSVEDDEHLIDSEAVSLDKKRLGTSYENELSSVVREVEDRQQILNNDSDDSSKMDKEQGKNTPKRGRRKKTALVKGVRLPKARSKKQSTRQVRYATPEEGQGYPAANRDYEPVPVSDYKDDDHESDDGRRRSRRARFPPLAFWKNERLIYEAQHENGLLGEVMGDMPVVAGVLVALPTPYKKRKALQGDDGQRKSKTNNSKMTQFSTKIDQAIPFDSSKLRRKHDYNDGEMALTWDESVRDVVETKIICHNENMVGSELPLSKNRLKGEGKVVGKAAQAFNVTADPTGTIPGWISGNLLLPPLGIKDAEGVGSCSQVFNVGDCQPNSLEVAIADPEDEDEEFSHKSAQRFLLSKGDMFHVPPGNIYRVENHSTTDDCLLFWTIIRPSDRIRRSIDDSV